MISLKIYLKSRRGCVEFECPNQEYINEFYHELMTKDICKFNNIIFAREEFKYALID